jgi:hypothetical protein
MRESSDDKPTEGKEGEPSSPSGVRIDKLGPAHIAMAELLLATPTVTQQELAERFSYSTTWVSKVVSSRVFQDYLEARRSEIRADSDERLRQISEETTAVALLAIRKLKANLEGGEVNDAYVLRAFELSSRALGMGRQAEAPPRETRADEEVRLARLAENLTSILGKKKAELGAA